MSATHVINPSGVTLFGMDVQQYRVESRSEYFDATSFGEVGQQLIRGPTRTQFRFECIAEMNAAYPPIGGQFEFTDAFGATHALSTVSTSVEPHIGSLATVVIEAVATGAPVFGDGVTVPLHALRSAPKRAPKPKPTPVDLPRRAFALGGIEPKP